MLVFMGLFARMFGVSSILFAGQRVRDMTVEDYFKLSIFNKIFCERNSQADTLSKQGLQLTKGTWKLWEHVGGNNQELDPGPLIL